VFVTLLTPRPVDVVRATVPGSGDRFSFRARSRVVEVTGRFRSDGAGTRVVCDSRIAPLVAVPLGLALGVLVLVSFSEPVVFAALAVVVVAGAVSAGRLVRGYRAARRALLDALAAALGATELPGPIIHTQT